MKLDVLVAEIGSTTTVLSAFTSSDSAFRLIGQSESSTTVSDGDVTIGINAALDSLKDTLTERKLDWDTLLACSSAAGGLKMTVHGLVYDMTVRAAKEAALGAGGVIKHVTAGKLGKSDIERILEIQPKLILLAGGVDYGESDTVLFNSNVVARLDIDAPVIFAGNCAVASEAEVILRSSSKDVYVRENVYPRIDDLNVGPTREVIRQVFSEHIIKAPGMEKIYSVVDREVIPTPAAVMIATELLSDRFGDVMMVDIGGATTDVDSVTDGDPEIQAKLISPEPRSKRTVEGDLGVYINARHVADSIGRSELAKEFDMLDELMTNVSPFPGSDRQSAFVSRLASHCLEMAVRRHAGRIRRVFGSTGRIDVAEGKDLTAVKMIVGTGGILARSNGSWELLRRVKTYRRRFPQELLPDHDIQLAIDREYIAAACGVLSMLDKEAATRTLASALEIV